MKNEMNWKKAGAKAAAFGLCACVAVMSPYQSMANMMAENESMLVQTGSNAVNEFRVYTESNVMSMLTMRSIDTGDIWANWVGDLSFLSGEKGNGTQEKPYQISTKEQLMGLSELTAKGMVIEDGEGTYPGDYRGCYFILTKNINLGGMEWIPIGFYAEESDLLAGNVQAFHGHFDGNGKTVSNFTIYRPEWKQAGLFGVIEDSEIVNLTVKPGYVLTAKEQVGILGGTAIHSVVRDVTVSGSVRAEGTAGGVFGELSEDTIVENCTADHVAVDSGSVNEVYTGGIAGKAAESLIVDCVVNTGDSMTARIQGEGYVGGIVGFQNGTDIFNVHVMGTIGGNGSQAIGGVTGKYASGKMKVARFEGVIADSGLGSLSHEGTFLGTHDSSFIFRYGVENGADLAYLFADSEEKIAAGVCGSGISDDNRFGYDAHIGFWHGKDNFFTLVQGQNTKAETESYFYEELEEGILHIIDAEDYVRDQDYTPDHFAPNAVGRPTRGYLVSVLQVDTAANVEDYYDVATLTARGESVYSKEMDKDTRAAVAAGDVVTVMTAPKNTENEKYQMDGVPTFTNVFGERVDMAYQTGGSYSFVMPAHDTEISAEYRKVAADVRIAPEEFVFRVIQVRSGNRKNPSIVTEVKDGSGKLIARYLDGTLQEGTQVQEVTMDAIVDKNNDVADSRVSWSVDDSELLILKKNADEDPEGYTAMSASVELNLQADFFRNIITQAEKEQEARGYRYAIPDTVYGNGTQGGLAVLTAMTRPASSFEGKPVEANCRIPVTFQIKDRTTLGVEDISFDKEELEFTVTRKLTGNRKNPKEEILVSGMQTLAASFAPDAFDVKSVEWSLSDPYLVQMDSSNYKFGDSKDDYKMASVRVIADSKWIRDLMAADDEAFANNQEYLTKQNIQRTMSAEKTAMITVAAADVLGTVETATCKVCVNVVTKDETRVYGYGSGSSSGGSSGSSSGGGSKKQVVSSEKSVDEDTMIKNGVWTQNQEGKWMYLADGMLCKEQWAYIYNPYADEAQERASWFRFDSDGIMCVGWYQSIDGGWYYLHDISDGNQGHMYKGWHEIDGIWYFFGTDGRMFYSTMTPDGYVVDEHGAWVPGETVQ